MNPPAQRRPTEAEALTVWRRYRSSGDVRHRNELVTMYLGMVRHLAFKKAKGVPLRCELDDLVSCGVEALIHAIERFDPAKGATLEQLAWIRIEGAILDELRRQDWAPRSVRRGERRLQRAESAFTGAHHRAPSDRELAEAAGMEHHELKALYGDIVRARVSSLQAPVKVGSDGTRERIEILASSSTDDPATATLRNEAIDRLRTAINGLGERDRQVVELLYERGLTQREVGEILGLTESRVSQIHTRLRNALSLALSAHRECFDAVV